MLIQLLKKLPSSGYVGESPGALPHISNCNLCLRRDVILSLGGYDPHCSASEDLELCARISTSQWLMFYCADMVVFHHARRSVSALLKQWWSYGKFVPYVFGKYNRGQWEVFLNRPGKGLHQYEQILYLENMPGSVCIFVTGYLLFHLLLFAAVLCAIFHHYIWAPLFLGASLFPLWNYLSRDFETGVTINSIKVACLRYLLNWTFFIAHIVSGFKQGALYIPHMIGQQRGNESGFTSR